MAYFMKITAILTSLSTIILIVLSFFYFKNMQKVKSKFTLGLLLFALLFLIQNLVSLYFYFTMMNYYAPEVSIHVFVLSLLQLLAFLLLLKLTLE
ncbi:hypothetical protein HYT51_03020 [Candidatus Woesearchaeota archaeon]|nr:hypothetical protein [Candidatus Woesearchaeota archaeon]